MARNCLQMAFAADGKVCSGHLLEQHFCPSLAAKVAKLKACAYFLHVL